MIADVIAGAALGIAQNGIRFVNTVKALGTAGFAVIGVEALREQPIDPVNRVGFGVGTNLQRLIVIQLFGVGHSEAS